MRFPKYILLIVVLGLFSCANPKPPTGGPRDFTPPRLDSTESTPGLQTNFEKQPIILSFDEYVQLQNPNQNAVISPPLENSLDFSISGASVRITFDEEETLRPNTTYTLNMSNAIQDLNEGNPAEDLRFVFSTGPVIDSLEMRAEVRDALTDKPVGGINVLLYDRMVDSVIYEEKPYYFATTDSNGIAHLQNLNAGNYKVVALEDVNKNLIYDLPEEKLGFLKNPVRIDTADRAPVSIRITAQDAPLIVSKQKQQYRGSAQLAFNRPPGRLTVSGKSVSPQYAIYRDSMYLWWTPGTGDSVEFGIEAESFSDTLSFADPDTLPRLPLQLRKTQYASAPPVRQYWNQPLDTFLPDRMLGKDSLPASNTWTIRREGPVDDQLLYRYKKDYPDGDTMMLLPGAVEGRFDGLKDTLYQYLSFHQPDQLAILNIKMDSLDSAVHYLARLVGEEDRTKEFATTEWTGKTQYKWTVSGLQPQPMVLEVIRDENQNGRWDPTRYLRGEQAEPIFRRSVTNLRANWEIEIVLEELL